MPVLPSISARSETEGNDFARAASFSQYDVPTSEFVGTSIDEVLHENSVNRLSRFAWNWTREDDETDNTPVLSAEDAAAKYGLEGKVKFNGPVKESVARAMHDDTLAQLNRSAILERGQGLIQKGSGLSAQLATSLLDPVNIALSFVPVAGEARYGQLLRAFSSTERFSKLALSPTVAEVEAAAGPLARLGARTVTGGANAGVGNVGLGYLNSLYTGTPYYAGDAVNDAAFGFVLGAALHAIPGAIGDHFRKTDIKTPTEMGKAAIADMVRGEDVTSPAKVLDLDPQRAMELARIDPEIVNQWGAAPKELPKGTFESPTDGLSLKEFTASRFPEGEQLPGYLKIEPIKTKTGEVTMQSAGDYAAYVASQVTDSYRKEAAVKYLTEQLHLSPDEIQALGQRVRDLVKRGEYSEPVLLNELRRQEVERRIQNGEPVAPRRLEEFPEIRKNFKTSIEKQAIENSMQAFREFTTPEGFDRQYRQTQIFNQQRDEAILAKWDQLLSERGRNLSDQVQSTAAPKFTDLRPEEKSLFPEETPEEKHIDPVSEPDKEIELERQKTQEVRQELKYALDEGLKTQLGDLDKQISFVESITGKLKDLANCVWGAL